METGGMSLIFGEFFGSEWRAVAPWMARQSIRLPRRGR
jgi:hypothetical protein